MVARPPSYVQSAEFSVEPNGDVRVMMWSRATDAATGERIDVLTESVMPRSAFLEAAARATRLVRSLRTAEVTPFVGPRAATGAH